MALSCQLPDVILLLQVDHNLASCMDSVMLQSLHMRELVKRGITELRNNEISKTYLLQIVQIITCSIAVILYSRLATDLHGTPRQWIDQ